MFRKKICETPDCKQPVPLSRRASDEALAFRHNRYCIDCRLSQTEAALTRGGQARLEIVEGSAEPVLTDSTGRLHIRVDHSQFHNTGIGGGHWIHRFTFAGREFEGLRYATSRLVFVRAKQPSSRRAA